MLTEEQRTENIRLCRIAVANARKVLKPGDRIRVTKCPGTKRWTTFAEWRGEYEIISKSGRGEYHPRCVDMLNGQPVDFTKTPNVEITGGASAPSQRNEVERS
jgi:hypothetical protein